MFFLSPAGDQAYLVSNPVELHFKINRHSPDRGAIAPCKFQWKKHNKRRIKINRIQVCQIFRDDAPRCRIHVMYGELSASSIVEINGVDSNCFYAL